MIEAQQENDPTKTSPWRPLATAKAKYLGSGQRGQFGSPLFTTSSPAAVVLAFFLVHLGCDLRVHSS